MAATDARPVPRKNTAYRHYFAIRKNDGTLITTWAGADSELSQDGGTFADATNEATEIGSSGCGYIDLTSAEMNNDAVMLKVTVTNTDALPYVVVLFPQESGDIQATAEAIGSNAVNAAAIATDAVAEIVGGVWSQTVPGIYGAGTAGKKLGDLSPLDASGVRAAVGLASADLDTQLSGMYSKIDTIEGVVDSILADTDELQGNQGDWITATGFATNAQMADVANNVNDIGSIAVEILADTNELQSNQGDWLTATGFSTHSASDVWSVATRVLTSGANIVLAKGTGLTGLNDLSESQMAAAFAEIKGDSYEQSTDSLRAIRARGDAAWVTGSGGGGGGSIDAEAVWNLEGEDGFTYGQIVRGLGAVLLGRTVIEPDGTVVFRSVDDSRDGVAMHLSPAGVRSGITMLLGP